MGFLRLDFVKLTGYALDANLGAQRGAKWDAGSADGRRIWECPRPPPHSQGDQPCRLLPKT